ncbi:unnamed protein product [Paramecium pentaurelia]|uniref:Uncharacterized protein n=1 Tax=Paramecium pentaurelia TaxID=43138 RepID=A0A8S1YJS1_9CILI|nr:unnamed protein product [Paramecium pentaurelia]
MAKYKESLGLFINQYSLKKILCEGIYNQGQQIGKWKSYKKSQTLQAYIKLLERGGGLYNVQGQKNGKWIDLDDEYELFRQITHSSEYFNGKQKGNWYILYKEDSHIKEEVHIMNKVQRMEKEQKFQITFKVSNLNQLNFASQHILVNFRIVKKKEGGLYCIKDMHCKLFQRQSSDGGYYNQIGLKNNQWIETDDNFLEYQYLLIVS